MSFLSYKDIIEEGDTVILYVAWKKMFAIEVKPLVENKDNKLIDNVFQTVYGALMIKSLIGKRYGTKIFLKRGYVYALHPTPELWTLTLPHRTQIIYTSDISLILFQLELQPGCIVLEAGTGSGSLTHALARSVYPCGHVHSFEFHERRAEIARAEFLKHGLTDTVTVYNRDITIDGFGDDMKFVVDSVFLDLPLPWSVIPFVVSAIKRKGGRFVSFSPCIEQVQKTHAALNTYGFVDVTTIECLQREFTIGIRHLKTASLEEESDTEGILTGDGNMGQKLVTAIPPYSMPGHTGYITCATLPLSAPRTNLTPTRCDAVLTSSIPTFTSDKVDNIS